MTSDAIGTFVTDILIYILESKRCLLLLKLKVLLFLIGFTI